MALSPVMVADVAQAAERLAAGRHRGIWHLGSSDEIGYFDAARLMAETRHLPSPLVQGEALTEAQVPEIYRHRYVTLSSCEKIAGRCRCRSGAHATSSTRCSRAFRDESRHRSRQHADLLRSGVPARRPRRRGCCRRRSRATRPRSSAPCWPSARTARCGRACRGWSMAGGSMPRSCSTAWPGSWRACRTRADVVAIISHKTELAHHDPP